MDAKEIRAPWLRNKVARNIPKGSCAAHRRQNATHLPSRSCDEEADSRRLAGGTYTSRTTAIALQSSSCVQHGRRDQLNSLLNYFPKLSIYPKLVEVCLWQVLSLGVEHTMTKPLWPLYAWVLHLGLPSLAISYAGARLLNGVPPGRHVLSAAALATCWFVTALGVVLNRRGRQWLITNRFKWSSAFVSATIAGVAVDFVLTVSGVVPTISALRAKSLEYRPAVYTYSRLRPNQSLHDQGVKAKVWDGNAQTYVEPKTPVTLPSIDINELGLRGSVVANPKRRETCRILFLGGSQVFGLGSENWPLLAGEYLLAKNLDVDVINGGVPGHTTFDSVGKVQTEFWLYEPDIIVLCQAWNDIKYFPTLNSNRPWRDVVEPLRRDWRLRPNGVDYLACFSSLYRLIRADLISNLYGDEGERRRSVDGHFLAEGLAQYRLNVETLCDISRNIGAQIVLCKQPRLVTEDLSEGERRRISYDLVGLPHSELVAAFAECDRIIDEIAASKHCLVSDLSGPMSGHSLWFDDHIHFTVDGGRQAANLLGHDLLSVVTNLKQP